MKKRILKLVLALSVASQALIGINVSAASAWSIKYNGSSNTDRTTYYAELSTGSSYSSDNSMKIQYNTTVNEANWVEITGSLTESLVAEKSYDLSFYMRGTRDDSTEIIIGDEVLKLSDCTRSAKITDAPSGAKNWYNYTYTIDSYSGSASNKIAFKLYKANNTYLDDISLTCDGGENLVKDSSFDGTTDEIVEVQPYDTTDYQPTRVLATSGMSTVALSWVNPKASELSGVSVYDVTEGEVLLSSTFSTDPEDACLYKIDGASTEERIYMLKFDFTDKESVRYYTSVASGAAGESKSIGAWSAYKIVNGAAVYGPYELAVDNSEYHTGSSSMKIVSNYNATADPDLIGNNYAKLRQDNLSLKAGKTYELSFWAKSQDLTGFSVMVNWFTGFTDVGSGNGMPVNNLSGDTDWNEYKFQYIPAEDQSITVRMLLAENSGVVWLDDFSMYELDDNGEVTGSNLILDSGFEDLIDLSTADIESVTVSDISDSSFNLSWTANSSKVQKIKIYEKVFPETEFEAWVSKGIVSKGISGITIEGLQMGTEYAYKLVPVNEAGIEGEAYEITAQTTMPDYDIKEPVLKKGNFAVEEPNSAGAYSVTTEIKNYAIEDMPVTQVVAVYKEGALEKVYATESVLDIQEKNTGAKKIVTSFSIPDTGYTAKVFILDSITSRNPYIKCTGFPDLVDKTLSQNELLNLMSGYVKTEISSDGYISGKRFTDEQKSYYDSQGAFYQQYTPIENTMLRFETNSDYFSFEYKKVGSQASGYLDVYVDGECKEAISVDNLAGTGTYTYNLDGEEHKIEIYLPKGGLSIKNLTVNTDSNIAPVDGTVKALFYGDSITQGMGLDHYSDNYVSVLSRLMNYENVNHGVSGYIYDAGQVIAQNTFVPDIVFVAYGSNNASPDRIDQLESNMRGFMNKLVNLYPSQKIYVITPTWTNWNDRDIPAAREIVEEVAAEYNNVTIIDGDGLLPKSAGYFSDGIHPNINGSKLMAENIKAAIEEN